MTEPLPEFQLGIIGGCMSHQRGTPLNALYHRQLAAMLEADPGVRLRPHIGRDFEATLRTRFDRLLAEWPLDGVLIHLRAARMVAPARLFCRTRVNGGLHSGLNPALLRRSHPRSFAGPSRWSSIGVAAGIYPAGRGKPRGPDAYDHLPDLQDLPPQGLRIAGFRVRDLNLALGMLVALDRWAIAEELYEFDEVERACSERGLPLFVLGPTPTTSSSWTNRITARGNVAIRRRLSGTEVPFALIEQLRDSAGHQLTRADGIHQSIEGHRFVAEWLYSQGMREWVAGILAART